MQGRFSSGLLKGVVGLLLIVPTGYAVYLLMPRNEAPREEKFSAFDISDADSLKGQDEVVDYTPKDADRSGLSYFKKDKKEPPRKAKKGRGRTEVVVDKVLRGTKWAVEFVKNPREFMYRETLIGNPGAAKKYLNDPEKVAKYLDMPSTKLVMDNPKVAAALLRVTGIADIALKSPAGRDPEVLKALVKSGLLDRAVGSRSGQVIANNPKLMAGITRDPAVAGMVANPIIAKWMATSGEGQRAMQALGRAGKR